MKELTRKYTDSAVSELYDAIIEENFETFLELIKESGPLPMTDFDRAMKHFSPLQIARAIQESPHFSADDDYFTCRLNTLPDGTAEVELLESSANILDLTESEPVYRQAKKMGMIDRKEGYDLLDDHACSLYVDYSYGQYDKQIQDLATAIIINSADGITGNPEPENEARVLTAIKSAIDELTAIDEEMNIPNFSQTTAFLAAVYQVFFE